MTAISTLQRLSLFRRLASSATVLACAALAACGGSADAPPPPESGPVVVAPVPPTITQQPASASVTTGQPASFSVAASGTQPITYQWERNGVAIAGATATSYAIATTAMSDSGAVFHAIATNVAGSATSDDATLTVTAAPPVLTVTTQPANAGVVAGATASFTVAATCSSGALDVQWERSNDGGVTFVAVVGATAATDSFMAATGDNGAEFKAALDCSGQSAATSGVATLTVTSPSSVSLSLLPITGLRAQADVSNNAGIVQDAAGSYSFIANNSIKRLSADYSTVTFVAGVFAQGSIDGPGTSASFRSPTGIARDAAGTLYITDTGNNTIRTVALDGTVGTLAGSPGMAGAVDGTGAAARFNGPTGIAIGPDGDLYVADTGSYLASYIRRVTTAGVVTTYAGMTGANFADGPAATAGFSAPMGIAVAPNGDVYVADYANHRIRKIARNGNTAGNVTTIAGDGTGGTADGIGTAAQIPAPVAIDLSGNVLYVSDQTQRVRMIDLTTTRVTTFAGTAYDSTSTNLDGPVGKAHFNHIAGIVAGTGGGLLVTDKLAIRTVSTAGTAVTVATQNAYNEFIDGIGTLSQIPFSLGPTNPGLLVEPGKSVVVVDPGYMLVRRIAPTGSVSLIAGLPTADQVGPAIDGQGSGAQFDSRFMGPIVRDASGTLYLTDLYGVRRITSDGTVTFIAGSPTTSGQADGNGSAARFVNPAGIAIGQTGDLFVSSLYEIRRVDALGNVTTFAGSASNQGMVDGPIASALFSNPTRMAFGPDGVLYIADSGALRTISADGQQVSTIPGVYMNTGAFAVDSSGTIYYDGAGPDNLVGLHSQTAAGATTLLIARGSAVVLGSAPSLPLVATIAVYGPKQLLLSAGSDSVLYIATTP